MKKLRVIILSIIFFGLSHTTVKAEGFTIKNPTALGNIGKLIEKVSGVSTPLAVIGFIFMVIYAGFIRMTAAGNPEKEAKGMKIAVSAMIGFAIIALAPLLIRVIASLIGVDPGISGFT